jgi:hypothetical protein
MIALKYESVLLESETVYPDVAEKIFTKKGSATDGLNNG